ncbi:DUF4232 domain-containing protein [Nocardia brasiliensis]|uniref:DUF4232 domain-containing protein n=1 Tax=Nocardia brasiliensis TaxID=37326 RepID=UPI0009DCD4B9
MRGTALALLAVALPLTACGADTPDRSGAATTPSASATTLPPPPASSPAPPLTTAPEGISSCAAKDLTVTAGTPEGATGHVYLSLRFTNTGTVPCSLTGYPTVSLAAGTPPTPVGPPAEPDTESTLPQPLTLSPGSTAASTLRYTQAGNFECDRAPTTHLLVAPPNAPVPHPFPFTATACTNPAYLLLRLTHLAPAP